MRMSAHWVHNCHVMDTAAPVGSHLETEADANSKRDWFINHKGRSIVGDGGGWGAGGSLESYT